MATIITMPQKGLSEESAVITEWHFKKGDRVKVGDGLFSIEIGKATFLVESEAEGVILEIIGKVGDEIAVTSPVCVIGETGENYKIQHVAPDGNNLSAQSEEKLPKFTEKLPAQALAKAYRDGERICISSRARASAIRKGIDYRFAAASGPDGRIIERDIEDMLDKGPFVTDAARAYANGEQGSGICGAVTTADIGKEVKAAAATADMPDAGEYTVRQNSRVRKTIANNMYRSLRDMAQLTCSTFFDATELLRLREKIKASAGSDFVANVSLNDMIIYAAARTLAAFPDLNAYYSDDEMKLFKRVHMGMAVDTDRGLMVPTIKYADKKSLNEIAAESIELAAQCRTGQIAADKLTGGTFTISNLGVYGLSSFSPIINPPQTGLLGVCGIDWKVRIKNAQPEYYQAMGLSLTFDHRAVDGAPAARFLKALCDNLENFTLLLFK